MLQTRERAENFPPQIINESGEIQIAFGPNIDTQGSFSNNLLAVQSGRRTQYWNKQGKQAFARSFDSGMDFSQGLAAVKDGRWGFIDGTGQFVIANNYDYALSFSEGLAAVLVGRYWGFVNQRGEVVIEPIYEKVLPFSNGLALVKLRDKVGYLDNNGHLSIPAVFDSGRSFSEGLAEVGFLDNEKHELRLCYINTSGKVCIDTSKIEIEAEPAESEADIYKLDDGKTVFGFKSAVGMSSGEHLPRDFHCGLAGIKLGKNYGYINKDGKVVIKPVYNVVYDFSENLATVRPGFNFDKAVIDTSGRIIVGPQYQEISQFHDGIAAVNRWEHTSANALWGYINTKGEQTLPLQYFEAAPFSNGLARVRPTPMSLAAAKYVAVDSTPAMTALPANMSPWAQSAVNKTAAAWPADTICDVDKRARFTFQLDHAGNAYDITFAGGCASPKTMIATVHSLLFAMPFEKPPGSAPIVLDLESDSDGKPKIRIGLAKDTALNSEAKILDGMPGKQTSTSQNVVRQWMYEKLLFLCEKVAKYPDSPSVKAELGKVLKAFALNPASAHDWLCVARGNPGELALRQNPDDKDERNCNAPVGALFQAWRLQKQKDNLYELEDAYRCKLALDLLRLNGDKPLFRGIAAELIDEYSTAVNNYSQCASASPFAKKLAIRFAHKVTSGSVSQNAEYAVNGKDWRTVVKWLPVDSEVLIAVLNPQPETKGDPNRMVSSLFESMQGMLGAMKREGVDIRFALHGGRNFHSPRDIGIGTQAGADIRIFGSALPASDRNAGTAPRTDSDKVTAATEKIEGFDIVVEEWKPRFSQSSVSFTARPYANVEITATDRHYLRQILRRMRSKPIDRAFPDSLPEWAAIDLKSDCWSVRHFDRGYAPFDGSAPKTLIGSEAEDEGNEGAIADTSVTGFTFCGNKDGAFKVSYLGSNPNTIKAMAGVWNHYPEINTGQFWGTGKGPKDYKMSPLKVTFSADKKAVTAAGKTTKVTAPMLNLMLMNQLGYMVAL
ncbi:MAG: WG repeat-containing protein [Cyanobacteria bacterium SZAS LIN-2]|nr:WG repeat-containing protein [Cyanobacteria bacterium SZAS LIN-2]